MFNRQIINYLLTWKDKKNRKPLIIRGARQVGKTSAVLLFAQKYFKQIVHLNLEKSEQNRWFKKPLSLNEFEQVININFGQTLEPGKTLLFIDEIQESPHLINLLRFFKEEKPQLHVISAGSLFEVKLKQSNLSLPVGRVEFMWLQPLNFQEYLEASEETCLADFLHNFNFQSPILEAIHQKALSLFYQYALVGGMPEAVRVFLRTKDLQAVNEVYSNLLTSFKDDVYKYTSLAKSQYLTFVLDQAPLFSGQTISYEKFGASNYKSREMGQAFTALSQAMVLFQVRATKSAVLPLTIKTKKPPKLLFLDVGLVNFQMGIQPEYTQLKDLDNFYQGRMAEQIVGQQLLSGFIQFEPKIFYWYKKTGSEAEVDFCLNWQGKILGIEVKSGSKGRLKSIYQFVKTTGANQVLRVYSGPFSREKIKLGDKSFTLISLPFYLFNYWQKALQLTEPKV